MCLFAWGLYVNENGCFIPKCIATPENDEFLNSLLLSDRIFLLPLNLQFTSFRYAFTTVSADAYWFPFMVIPNGMIKSVEINLITVSGISR